MMSSPIPTLVISCLYLFFLWAGPRYMQDRQPYTLRKTLIVYNFSMVVLNFYIAKEVGARPRQKVSQFVCHRHTFGYQVVATSPSLTFWDVVMILWFTGSSKAVSKSGILLLLCFFCCGFISSYQALEQPGTATSVSLSTTPMTSMKSG